MKKSTTTKTVVVLARIQFKSDPRKVCYLVRSSNGVDQYTTCLFDGFATGCSCPATNGKCYHRCQALEQERTRNAAQAKTELASIPLTPVVKAHAFAELKKQYDCRQNPSTRATDMVLQSAKRRQSAPLAGASRGFSLMR